ncbi:MAG: hypothetical protein ABI972_08895 [Acidobacteriota bacterium]
MRLHPGGTDTDPRAAELQMEAIRAMSVSGKVRQVCELTELALAFHRAGLRRRYPQASEAELQRLSVSERYGEDAAYFLFGPRQS